MTFEPFAMERWQSLHEHQVEINLSDSGVHPVTLRELLDQRELAALGDQRLGYTQTDGTPELRRAVAALYEHTGPDEVEIVNGGAEANFLVAWALLEPGDEVVVMLPNYMQVPGLARNLGAAVVPWHLLPDLDAGCWRLDLDALENLVSDRTKLIAICNPNNPTGARFTAVELDAVARIADRHGAWILADEIYQGAELDGAPTPTIRGRSERAIVTNSLSKAYGLPGLRLGWVVAPSELIAELWARHDYTTIAPGALSDRLGTFALEPVRRARLLARGRELLVRNHAAVATALADSRLSWVPPAAGAFVLARYPHAINSTALAERLRAEQSVLVVPGDHFGMDGWLRLGFGAEIGTVRAGLARLTALLATLPVR